MSDTKLMDRQVCGFTQSSGSPVEHVIIAKDPTRHLAFPDVCQLRSKELFVVYRDGAKHVDSSGRIMLVRGRAVGSDLEFQEPEVVCDTDWDDRDPSVVELSNGTILINFFRLNIHTGEIRLSVISSVDAGQSWAPIHTIAFPEFSEGLACSDAILEMPSGDLVMAVYGKADDGQSGSYMIRSSDGGLTWPILMPLAVSNVPIFEEPSLALFPDGRIRALLRTDHKGCGYVYQTESSDFGMTWFLPEKSKVWGYPQDLLVLQDGQLLVTYGYRQLPTGIRMCVGSPDSILSIEKEGILRSDGHDDGELGYPSSVELKEGEILTVYYFTDSTGGQPYIAGTRHLITTKRD